MTSVISPVFQRLLSASQIEDAVKSTLQTWFPTYLREVEKQMGLPANTLVTPENYTNRNSFQGEAGEELPKIVVITPGIIGPPIKKGNGSYTATWRVGVGIATGAPDEETTNTWVKAYAAAARGLLLQETLELEPTGAVDVVWTDEAFDDVPIASLIRLVKAASLYFSITVPNMVTRKAGPLVPDESDYDYEKFEHVYVDLENVGLYSHYVGQAEESDTAGKAE